MLLTGSARVTPPPADWGKRRESGNPSKYQTKAETSRGVANFVRCGHEHLQEEGCGGGCPMGDRPDRAPWKRAIAGPARERLREAVGNLIKCVAVDKAKCLVVNNMLTQPMITSTEVLHAACAEMLRRGSQSSSGKFRYLRTTWWDRGEECQDQPE
jgi:hypothetical protein